MLSVTWIPNRPGDDTFYFAKLRSTKNGDTFSPSVALNGDGGDGVCVSANRPQLRDSIYPLNSYHGQTQDIILFSKHSFMPCRTLQIKPATLQLYYQSDESLLQKPSCAVYASYDLKQKGTSVEFHQCALIPQMVFISIYLAHPGRCPNLSVSSVPTARYNKGFHS